MPRPLKIFRAHLGFYDSIVAAPSQKAALEAWSARPSEFRKGFASVTNDPDAVKAALAQPGVVLRRPFGSGGEFKADAELPTVPKLTAKQKAAKRRADDARKKVLAGKARAEKEAERRRAQAAARELAELEDEEKRLQARRAALKKKLRQ